MRTHTAGCLELVATPDFRAYAIRRDTNAKERHGDSPDPPGDQRRLMHAKTQRSAPVRAVLFDFGGVVAEEGFRDGLRAIASSQGLDPEAVAEAAVDAVYESGYVTGHGAQSEFWALLRQRTGLQGDPRAWEREILTRFRVRDWMLDWVRRLRRAGYRTALVTDQTDWLERLDERHAFLARFDRIFNSYRIGKGKRDPTLFDDVLRELNVAPDQALLVDDAPDNLARACDRGLRVLHFVDRAGFESEMAKLLDAPSPPETHE